MWPLARLSKPRDIDSSVVPVVCYDSCNNAYLESVARGKTATLCISGSAFQNYYLGCNECVKENGGNTTALDALFSPFVDFCKATESTTPTASIDVVWLTTYTTFTPAATLSLATSLGGKSYPETLYKPATAFSTRPEYFFHLSVGSMVSSYIPPSVFSQLASSVSLSAAAASVTGDATSLIHEVLESTSVPPWFSAAVPSTYSSQMYTLQEQINQLRATPVSLTSLSTSSPASSSLSSQTSQDPSSSSSSTNPGASTSKAWIAGPIVGGIAAASLLVLGVFMLQRRRRRRTAGRPELEGDMTQATGDKPQLHSDHLPPRMLYEMDASHNPSEADGGALPEMAANETPAQEMEVDHHHYCSRALDRGKDSLHPAISAEENM